MTSPNGELSAPLEEGSTESSDPSNPFIHKLHLGALQKLKICVLGAVLLPLRVIFILLSLSLATAIARIGLIGISDEELAAAPFTGWRLYIRHAIAVILRVMFAFCGFWPVKVVGTQAPPEEAPILCVAPHSTFFDALAVAVMGAPSVVAKAETKNVPFFGSLIRYTQPLLVHRTDPDSRKKTLDTMKERSTDGKGWQQVLIFPEGTCTNRTALITFRLGAFIPGVPVQPVILRYDNCYDTVTWTWEGIPAWKAIVYSLSQLRMNHSVEFLPPYSPSEEEVAKPQLFADNVRAVMASRMGVPVTDCSYYDYLRINKAEQTVKSLKKFQRGLEKPIKETIKDMGDRDEEAVRTLVEAAPEVSVVTELCGTGENFDLRFLRLGVLMATEEEVDAYETFLTKSFSLFDQDLGAERICEETLRRLAETFLFLPPKEVGEMVAAASVESEVSLSKLKEFIPEKRPNYIKAIRKWNKGLTESHNDLLALASFTAAAEKANQIMAAGKDVVSDVSATMAASREKMSGVLSNAVTSLHRRTGSGRVVIDKKTE